MGNIIIDLMIKHLAGKHDQMRHAGDAASVDPGIEKREQVRRTLQNLARNLINNTDDGDVIGRDQTGNLVLTRSNGESVDLTKWLNRGIVEGHVINNKIFQGATQVDPVNGYQRVVDDIHAMFEEELVKEVNKGNELQDFYKTDKRYVNSGPDGLPYIEGLQIRLRETPAKVLYNEMYDKTTYSDLAAFHTQHKGSDASATSEFVQDALRRFGADDELTPEELEQLNDGSSRAKRNYQKFVHVAAWLSADPYFAETDDGNRAEQFKRLVLGPELQELGKVMTPERVYKTNEGSEEIARRVLRSYDLRPSGENEMIAMDRMDALDTIAKQAGVSARVASAKSSDEEMNSVLDGMNADMKQGKQMDGSPLLPSAS